MVRFFGLPLVIPDMFPNENGGKREQQIDQIGSKKHEEPSNLE